MAYNLQLIASFLAVDVLTCIHAELQKSVADRHAVAEKDADNNTGILF